MCSPRSGLRSTSTELSDSARLGESLAVVPGWERAVETVLGHFLSALQVNDLDDFAASLADLPEGDLALVEISAAGFDGGAAESSNSSIELPSLNSLVRADAVNAISLLHGIYAAESTAVALASRGQLRPGQSIITREGFWVGRDWVRVLHDHDHEAGIIERGQQLETLTVRVEEAERTLGELQQHVQQGRARVEGLESQREELQQAVNGLQQDLSERRTDHGVTRVKIAEADARREQLAKDYADIVEQLEVESGHLDTARERLTDAEIKREGQAQVRAQLTAERETLDTALLAARDKARVSRC